MLDIFVIIAQKIYEKQREFKKNHRGTPTDLEETVHITPEMLVKETAAIPLIFYRNIERVYLNLAQSFFSVFILYSQ